MKTGSGLMLGSLVLLCSTMAVAQNSDLEGYNAPKAEKTRVKRESTGIISGLVVGGAVGGPPGAIFSAIAGGLLGDNISFSEQKKDLQASLDETRRQLYTLEQEKQALQEKYQLALEEKQNTGFTSASFSAAVKPGQDALCCADSTLELHFRTNSSVIEEHYQDQLEAFAKLARDIPDAVIEIDGYADRRGDTRANLALSELRVQAVENALNSLGIADSSLRTLAFGESKPLTTTETAEGNFFDRRVIVKLSTQSSDYLTQLNGD